MEARVQEFLAALNDTDPNALVSPPGLGGLWRARYVLEGLEKGVVVVHSSGMGLAISQPSAHGMCPHCAASKDRRTICDHCACAMCAWWRHAEERNSPRVKPEKVRQLALRMQAFRFARPVEPIALDADLA